MMALKQFEEIKSRSQCLVATLPSAYEYLSSRYVMPGSNGNGRHNEHHAVQAVGM
jgi:hypothetical protein